MVKKELPEGWEWKRLGDIGKIFSGSTPSTKVEENFNGDIPWITPADLSNFDEMYIQKGKKNISEKGLKSTSIKILPKGTVLFSSRAPVGYVAIADNPITTNQGFKNLVLNDDRIIPEYVFYYLKANKKLAEKYASGTTFLEVSSTRFSQIPIVIPPLETQRKIVAILEKAEATQRLRAEADALMQKLVQSVFLEMFGDPVKNPKKWDIKSLNEICIKVTDGTHDTPKPIKNGIPFITGQHIRDREICFNNSLFVSEEIHDEIFRRCNPEKGDVIFVHIGANIGSAAYVDVEYEFSMKNIALFKPKYETLDGRFLETYLILTKQNTIHLGSRGGAQKFLSIKEMKKIPCIVPPFTLQQRFAKIIESIKIIRENHDQSLIEISNFNAALISKAFTGELIA